MQFENTFEKWLKEHRSITDDLRPEDLLQHLIDIGKVKTNEQGDVWFEKSRIKNG